MVALPGTSVIVSAVALERRDYAGLDRLGRSRRWDREILLASIGCRSATSDNAFPLATN
jgi:hypothetical protein